MTAATDAADSKHGKRGRRTAHRVGLVLAIAMIAITVLLLPFIFQSVSTELLSRQDRVLYNGITGDKLSLTPPQLTQNAEDFVTVGVLNIDQLNSQVTLAVSGNRVCPATGCATVDLQFYALDDNASQRRGVPPVQTVTLHPEEVIFSQSITLPVRGTPNMYPFDAYQLWLGVSAAKKKADGTSEEITLAQFKNGLVFTLQNLDNSLIMAQPQPIPPETVHSPTDPYAFITVQSLNFREPSYLPVLAVLLVLMISISGGIAMTTRTYQDLVLGVSGIVLGIWGVRSVLAQSSVRGVTLLDLSLSVVILMLMLAFIVRSAMFFHSNAELPPIRRRNKRG